VIAVVERQFRDTTFLTILKPILHEGGSLMGSPRHRLMTQANRISDAGGSGYAKATIEGRRLHGDGSTNRIHFKTAWQITVWM
jgi:hypothetical protein